MIQELNHYLKLALKLTLTVETCLISKKLEQVMDPAVCQMELFWRVLKFK
jgi:hypothetical protein